MCFLYGLPVKDASDEGSREGIPSPHGAHDLYLRCSLEAMPVLPQHAAPVDSLRKDEHIQFISLHEAAAKHLLSGQLEAKESGDDM